MGSESVTTLLPLPPSKVASYLLMKSETVAKTHIICVIYPQTTELIEAVVNVAHKVFHQTALNARVFK